MDRMSRNALCVLGALFLALSGTLPGDSSAAVLRHSKSFVLPGAETIHDDLYAAGTTVDIQGTVDGDLIVGGQTITIGGVVTGDVIAAGRDVTISGSVGGTVRAAGNAITVDGTVGHDVVVGCGTLVLGPNAMVGRDVLAGAGTSSFGGRIARDVRLGSGSASFSGSVGGVVYARAKELRLNEGAVLERDLFYTSRNELTKASGAVVRGRVERSEPRGEFEHRRRFGGRLIGGLQGLIGFAILGALFYLLFAHAGPRTLEALGRAPWASLGLGVLLAFGFPCAAAFFFILGLIFGGWWIALGGLVLYFFALALGYVVSSTYVGRWILGRMGRGGAAHAWALLAGLVTLGLASAIPFLGPLLGLAAALFGLGALAMAWYQARRGNRGEAAATPAMSPQPSAT
jgi:cytoskeletal protein CcmA (bactofilin family)